MLIRAECCRHCRQKQISFVFLLSRSIAEHDMAKVEYAFPVDKIHGKIAKSHKVGFAHRTASKLNYTTSYGKRSTPKSESEIAWNTKFGEISRLTHVRMADPSKMTEDQQAFREQSQYKSLYQFVWHLVREELEA